jgi:8-oxo-dGTP diphosphatase
MGNKEQGTGNSSLPLSEVGEGPGGEVVHLAGGLQISSSPSKLEARSSKPAIVEPMPWYASEAACVLLVNPEGKLLLQLRDTNPYTAFPNHWGLIGGTIEQGETVEQGLLRETLEEIGEVLTGYTHFGLANTMYIDIHVYIARLDKDPEVIPLTEGQCVRYFHIDDAMRLPLVPWLQRMLPAVARSDLYRNLWSELPQG